MGCNCKDTPSMDEMLENKGKITLPTAGLVLKYTLKFMAFLMLVALIPVLNLYIIWLMFGTLMLNKSVDIKPLLMAIGTKFKEREDDDEEELDETEFLELTEDDVVLLDAVEITNEESKG